jgi:hypothetical protein
MRIFFNKTRFCSPSFPNSSFKQVNRILGVGGALVTTTTLGYYLYKIMNNRGTISWMRNIFVSLYNSIENKPVTRIEPYENKYYDLYEDLESCDLEEEYVKSLRNNILFESTPRGNIVMYYDFEKESFVYYCDKRDIPYLYLETAARNYAIKFRCKKIVIDMKHELMLANKKKNNSKLSNESEISGQNNNKNNNDQLFATFKSYNKKGTNESKDDNSITKFVLRQQANRYSYGGKFSQFQIIKPYECKIEKPIDNMNYEIFKRLMNKKN